MEFFSYVVKNIFPYDIHFRLLDATQSKIISGSVGFRSWNAYHRFQNSSETQRLAVSGSNCARRWMTANFTGLSFIYPDRMNSIKLNRHFPPVSYSIASFLRPAPQIYLPANTAWCTSRYIICIFNMFITNFEPQYGSNFSYLISAVQIDHG